MTTIAQRLESAIQNQVPVTVETDYTEASGVPLALSTHDRWGLMVTFPFLPRLNRTFPVKDIISLCEQS